MTKINFFEATDLNFGRVHQQSINRLTATMTTWTTFDEQLFGKNIKKAFARPSPFVAHLDFEAASEHMDDDPCVDRPPD